MNYRRVLHCVAVTCLIVLAFPDPARADEGRHERPETTEDCDEQSPETSDGDRSGSSRGRRRPEHDGGYGHDARDGDGSRDDDEAEENEHEDDESEHEDDDCVVAPPVEVPEAPGAIILSASAVVTGTAALVIVRRRARRLQPFGT